MPDKALQKVGVATVHAPSRFVANEHEVILTNSWMTPWKFKVRQNAGKATLMVSRLCGYSTQDKKILEELGDTAEIEFAHLLGFMESIIMAKMLSARSAYIAYIRDVEGMLHPVFASLLSGGNLDLRTDFSEFGHSGDWTILSRDLLENLPC